MPSAPTLDVAIALQALQRHGHGRRRNLKPMGQHGGNHVTPFGLGLEDGFQVISFEAWMESFMAALQTSLYVDRQRLPPVRVTPPEVPIQNQGKLPNPEQ